MYETIASSVLVTLAFVALALLDCANFAVAVWLLGATGLDGTIAVGGAVVWALGLALARKT